MDYYDKILEKSIIDRDHEIESKFFKSELKIKKALEKLTPIKNLHPLIEEAIEILEKEVK